MGLPVFAAARSIEVCRHKYAGTCTRSQTSPVAAAQAGSEKSEVTGMPNSFLTSDKISKPWSMPTPWKLSGDDLQSLSKHDLYTQSTPSSSQIFEI